jgi:CubicO group peptidase (beta-lactamase class C family)
VSKLLAAYAGLVAVEEGTISLDDPAGPPGSTVRHLLSHAAGYGFTGPETVAPVGRRRIYSNTGIDVFAEHLSSQSGMPFAEYLRDAVFAPLGMTASELRGSAAHAVHSTAIDLVRFARELLRPTLISPATLAEALQVQFPGLAGIVPGVGRFDPCDWGLGFERNLGKPGHWSGSAVSPESFGHFGGSGTFLVIDPTLDIGIVCLTDREFDAWALEAWPPFCDAVVSEVRAAAHSGTLPS